MNYRKLPKYKYQLTSTEAFKVPGFPDLGNPDEDFCYTKKGKLWVKEGYAWDGPSGPTIDTKAFIKASLVHDALYQILRLYEKNRVKLYRKLADQYLWVYCRKFGMSRFRANYVYHSVRLFGWRFV